MSFFSSLLAALTTPGKRKRQEASNSQHLQPSSSRLKVSRSSRDHEAERSICADPLHTPVRERVEAHSIINWRPQRAEQTAGARLPGTPQTPTPHQQVNSNGTSLYGHNLPLTPALVLGKNYDNPLSKPLGATASGRQALLQRHKLKETAGSNGLQTPGLFSIFKQLAVEPAKHIEQHGRARTDYTGLSSTTVLSSELEAAALQKLDRANQMDAAAEEDLQLIRAHAAHLRAEGLLDLGTAKQDRVAAAAEQLASPWQAGRLGELDRFAAAIAPATCQAVMEAAPWPRPAPLVPYDASPPTRSHGQPSSSSSSAAEAAAFTPAPAQRTPAPASSGAAGDSPGAGPGSDGSLRPGVAQAGQGQQGRLAELKAEAARSAAQAAERDVELRRLMRRVTLTASHQQAEVLQREIDFHTAALRAREEASRAAVERFRRPSPQPPPWAAASASRQGGAPASPATSASGAGQQEVLELSSDSSEGDAPRQPALRPHSPSQSASMSREEEEELSSALQEASVSGGDSLAGWEEVAGRRPRLSPHQRAQIRRALGPGPKSEVLVTHAQSNIDITRDIISCLHSHEWLNDEVINVYMALLQERDTARRKEGVFPKCHFYNSFFLNKLLTDAESYNYNNVRRWTMLAKLKRWGQASASILDCDKIICPVHLGNHWTTAVIDVRARTLLYLDSYKNERRDIMKALARYMVDEYADKADVQQQLGDWRLLAPKNIPQQLNGCDCGVFAVMYAEYHSRNAPLDFSEADMEYFRLKMTADIMDLKVD